MKKAIAILVSLAIASLLTARGKEFRQGLEPRRAVGGQLSSNRYPLFNGSTFTASVRINVPMKVAHEPGDPDPGNPDGPSLRQGRGLTWIGLELERKGEAYDARLYSRGPFPLSYHVDAVAGRHAQHFYTLGKSDQGIVIEQWTMPPENGGFYTERSVANTGIGVPAPVSSWSCRQLEAEYVSPKARTPSTPIRKELHSGRRSQKITCAAADPEGRYVLFGLVGTPSALGQLDIVREVVSDIFTEDLVPQLSELASIRLVQHATLGRMCILLTPDPVDGAVVLLFDRDNDGVFEADPVTYDDRIAFRRSPHSSPFWSDNFLDYEL